jgi:hypothetical protein
LTRQNIAADLPVEQDQFAVDGKAGAHLRRANALLQFRQEGGVVRGQLVIRHNVAS